MTRVRVCVRVHVCVRVRVCVCVRMRTHSTNVRQVHYHGAVAAHKKIDKIVQK